MKGPSDSSLRAPLRSRNFRALFYAQCISVLGDFLVPIALAFALLDAGYSATALGVVIASRMVPMVVFMLAGGVYADRVERHRLMVCAHAARCVTQVTLGSLILAGEASLGRVVLLQVANGIASAFYTPASSAIVPTVVRDPALLQSANALMRGAWSVGGVVGPALAGVAVATVGAGWAMIFDGATFVVAALFLLRLNNAGLGRPAPGGGFFEDLALGWRGVRTRTWLWASISHFSLFQLLNTAVIAVLGPVVAEESLGGAAGWATVTSAAGVGGILGYAIAPRVRPSRPLLVAFLLILPSIPTLLLLAARPPVVFIAAAELVAFGTSAISGNLWETTLQRSIPRELLSRVASYDWVGSIALRPLGLMIVGPVAGVVGATATLVGAAALLTVATIAVICVPSVRRLATPLRAADGGRAAPVSTGVDSPAAK